MLKSGVWLLSRVKKLFENPSKGPLEIRIEEVLS